jgi:outer membrane protein assembly factor BamB
MLKPVATGVPIIDLDQVPDGPEPDRRRPGARLRAPRAARVAAVLLIAFAALAAAAPPRPGLRPVLSAGGTAAAAFTLGRDALYTAAYGVDNPNSQSGVRRYDLTDGSLTWATSLPQGVQNLVVSDGAGVVMARSGTDPRASFLDAATGAVLWRSEAANTAILSIQDGGVLFRTDTGPGATVLRLAGARTGRTVWTRTVDALIMLGPDDLWGGRADRIVTVGAGGGVLTLDYATGRMLAEGSLGGPLRPAEDRDALGVRAQTVGDDLLVVHRRDAAGTSLTAYAPAPFRRLWRTGGSAGFVHDCGPVLCAGWGDPPTGSPVTGPRLSGLDPADGSVRWANGWYTAVRYDDRTLLAVDRTAEPVMALLDPATGRTLRSLGRVAPVGDLLLYPDSRADGRTWVYPPGATVPAGAVDVAAPFGCVARDRYLACPSTAGPTRVWRVPA